MPDYWAGDIPWITSADINGVRAVKPRKFISKDGIRHSATNLVPAHAIVVATRVGLGKVGLAGRPLAFSQDCQGLVTDPHLVDPAFAAHQLLERVQVFRYTSRGTTISGVTKRQLLDLPFDLAPAAEQRRIVAAIEELFSRIDAGVEALQRARRNLQRMRAAVLQAAVAGRLVPQHVDDEPTEIMLRRVGITQHRDADFPEIPESWAWVRFGDLLVLLRNGIFVSRPTDDPGGIPILRISAVRPLGLDPEDVRYLPADQSRDLQPFFVAHGDLLFTRYSGNPEFVGACAMVRNLPRPTLHPDKLIQAVVNEEVAKSAFVELVASTGYSRDYIRRRSRTTAGQTGVSGGDLKSMPVPLPPIAEQTRIVREVERQFSIIQVLARVAESSLERIASLRRAILSVAFQGLLVPQDFSDEPAEILLERVKAAGLSHELAAARPRRRSRS